MREQSRGMTVIVKTVTRWAVGLILLYGLYIIVHGHLTPGGGFGGGVVLALGLLSILLAYGREETLHRFRLGLLVKMEAAGPLLFLAVGLMGMAAGGAFLLNFLAKGRLFALFSSGVIPILNIIIGIKVGLSLFLVVLALAEFDPEKGAEE